MRQIGISNEEEKWGQEVERTKQGGGGGGETQDHSDPYAGFLHNYSQIKRFESSSRAIVTSIG